MQTAEIRVKPLLVAVHNLNYRGALCMVHTQSSNYAACQEVLFCFMLRLAT